MNVLHNDEAMDEADVEANDASANWEILLRDIREDLCYGAIHVELTDSNADLYDYANEILTRTMRDRLVETLRTTVSMVQFSYLTFGNKFFITMNEQQQQSFFDSIFNLPVCSIEIGQATDASSESPAITINTSALLEALPQIHTSVECLYVENFALSCQSHVQALSNIIRAKRDTFLESLSLRSIECPVVDYNKRDSDEPIGFLDPLLYAASFLRRLDHFSLSAKTNSAHSTLVNPRALRALFVEGNRFRALHLCGLGLNDSHVFAIVDGLSTPGTRMDMLNLESNPAISARGYGALLNLINRANVMGNFRPRVRRWDGFRVDDKAWKAELNLVSEMNLEHGRLEYLTNGTFTSEERRWQWLERVAVLPTSRDIAAYDDDLRDEADDDLRDEADAKHVNFIWYTLRQDPEIMQT
jgi:hypothetical protein